MKTITIGQMLNDDIETLNISSDVIKVLKHNDITILRQLCCKSKKGLKALGLKTEDIDNIEIKLQLLGMDLKTRY